MEYEPVIGLEVHAQLLTQSKIFCNCSTRFGEEPNTLTCPVCTGSPGSLPVLNKKVVEYTLRAALATHCQIAPYSLFARKNYFYPDLPKGYQISQYELPLTVDGYIDIQIDSQKKRIGIIRIHMEEDAGKLIHDLSSEQGSHSYVDFNRTGVPLIEIVSAPDIRSSEEASAYLRKLRAILMFLDICDGNMEEGSFRCDANISLRPTGRKAFGVKTEIKNINSFRNVQRALEFEIRRQTALLDQGEEVLQETRLWDAGKGVTISMRGKEEAHDYRYFPDPDLVPLLINPPWIEEIRATLPELPEAKKERFIREYGIPEYDAEILTTSKSLANYYESCLGHYPKPKIVSNWIMSELLRELKKDDREIEECPVPALHLSEMLKLIDEGIISGKIAKSVFEEMYHSGKRALEIVREKGLVQVSDSAEIEKIVGEVLSANPEKVEAYRKGKEKLFGFFVGQVMKATQGKANPQMVNELLKKKL
ncbi:MAG: Asp-tRNA(Asn)/Glu-tRNA(Gln) amidotransferase subunit GatB [Thermodesulfobacteriota bacterium]|nr:Asp-tRNA(Asn)/Glu-tRNA(Gln) amidotransferase subunit GatB [Thermodesulfobacteriota bacterium]